MDYIQKSKCDFYEWFESGCNRMRSKVTNQSANSQPELDNETTDSLSE